MFDHEKLPVYQVALEFVAWVYERVDSFKGNTRFARDELLRASQSIPRNIAEGNGKRSPADRSRFFQIGRGSALECAAVLDELRIMKVVAATEVEDGKALLSRIVSMLSKMTVPARGAGVHEDSPDYEVF